MVAWMRGGCEQTQKSLGRMPRDPGQHCIAGRGLYYKYSPAEAALGATVQCMQRFHLGNDV